MGFRETVRQLAEQAKLDSAMDTRKRHDITDHANYAPNSTQEIDKLRSLFAQNVGKSVRFAYKNRQGYGPIVSVNSSSVVLCTSTIERRFRSFALAYIYNVTKLG